MKAVAIWDCTSKEGRDWCSSEKSEVARDARSSKEVGKGEEGTVEGAEGDGRNCEAVQGLLGVRLTEANRKVRIGGVETKADEIVEEGSEERYFESGDCFLAEVCRLRVNEGRRMSGEALWNGDVREVRLLLDIVHWIF